MVRVFTTRSFTRWMRKTRLDDSILCKAVAEMTNGLIDADLGGGVVKKRIAVGVAASAEAQEHWSPRIAAIDGFSCTALKRAKKKTSRSKTSPPLNGSLARYCWHPQANWIFQCEQVNYRKYAMASTSKYRSRICKEMHETMQDLHKLGIASDCDMQKMDALCLVDPLHFNGPRIRALRERLQLSQARLASQLNTSVSTIRRWEKEEKSPSGPALQLLQLLERDGAGALP